MTKVGYESPSPIQAGADPTLMSGRDDRGLAQTGTGKTAAFALPVLARIDRKVRAPQALVSPDPRAALQVADSFQSFADPRRHLVLPIYGGQSYGIQLSGPAAAPRSSWAPWAASSTTCRRALDISDLRFLVLTKPTRC